MDLLGKIQNDLVIAQKARDQLATSTLRFVLSNLHNAKIEKGQNLRDEEILRELRKELGRHQESIEAFKMAGREELVLKELAEKAIIEKYLPKELAEGEISKLVDQAIADVGAQSMADFGRVMGVVMAKVAGRAEGKTISQVVRDKLEG